MKASNIVMALATIFSILIGSFAFFMLYSINKDYFPFLEASGLYFMSKLVFVENETAACEIRKWAIIMMGIAVVPILPVAMIVSSMSKGKGPRIALVFCFLSGLLLAVGGAVILAYPPRVYEYANYSHVSYDQQMNNAMIVYAVAAAIMIGLVLKARRPNTTLTEQALP